MMEITNFRNYRLRRQLGGGQFGEVWEGEEVTHSWRRAIKLLRAQHSADANVRARFLLEGHATGLVEHPGIVKIFEVGVDAEGTHYIVMELLEGEPLSQRMHREPLPLTLLLRIAAHVAGAMAAAHRCGVVHRDLKPANVMVVHDPDVPGGKRGKVVDFGLAKIPDEKYPELVTRIDTYLHTEVEKVIMGTALYMAPEQCRARREIDGRADVYALGSILYQALSGQPLFSGGVPAILASHMTEEPAPLQRRAPHVDAPLAALVHAMLRKEPHDRPSMAQVAAQLDRLMEGRDPAEPSTLLFQQGAPLPVAPRLTLLARLTQALRQRRRS